MLGTNYPLDPNNHFNFEVLFCKCRYVGGKSNISRVLKVLMRVKGRSLCVNECIDESKGEEPCVNESCM